MQINAIATGKKMMSFLDYEAVITPSKKLNKLSSVNILRQGKILVKIKTDISLDQYNANNLEQIIQRLIIDYIIGHETNVVNPDQFRNAKIKNASAKQAKARSEAANDLFSMFNL